MSRPPHFLQGSHPLSHAEMHVLVLKAQSGHSGSRAAAEALVRALSSKAWRLAVRWSYRTGLSADELFSTALLGIYGAISNFNASRGLFEPWALMKAKGLLRHEATKTQRQTSRQTALDDLESDLGTIGAVENALANLDDPRPAQAKALAKALRSLPAKERRVLRARFGVDPISAGEKGKKRPTQQDVGLREGVTRQTVSNIEQRAIAKLRTKLAKLSEPDAEPSAGASPRKR